MTAVVAVTNGRTVWLGADSAGVTGWQLTVRSDEKVFSRGPFVMGFTSSFRMGQLLRYTLTVPSHGWALDDREYMSTRFVDAVRDCLKTGGYAKKESEREAGGTFIVGYHGTIYQVYSDYQVATPVAPYAACGCGEDVALGALHATDGTVDPAERVRIALEAAEAHSAGVRGPFAIVQGAYL